LNAPLISLPVFILLLPLNCIFGICTFFDVGRPIFYQQTRVGKDGRHFTLVKFRNMNNKTDADGKLLPPSQRVPLTPGLGSRWPGRRAFHRRPWRIHQDAPPSASLGLTDSRATPQLTGGLRHRAGAALLLAAAVRRPGRRPRVWGRALSNVIELVALGRPVRIT
jgi:hypothetical protein